MPASLYSLFQTHAAEGWVKARWANCWQANLGFIGGEDALKAFRDGGKPKRLEGVWRATWSVYDEQHRSKKHFVVNPNSPKRRIAYPAEHIALVSSGSAVFCTSHDALQIDQPYWLQGRLSDTDELSLIYWNEGEKDNHYMTGTVFLRLVKEQYQGESILRGEWCGRTRDNNLVVGPVEWVKGRKT